MGSGARRAPPSRSSRAGPRVLAVRTPTAPASAMALADRIEQLLPGADEGRIRLHRTCVAALDMAPAEVELGAVGDAARPRREDDHVRAQADRLLDAVGADKHT